jgi:hypothetical protein
MYVSVLQSSRVKCFDNREQKVNGFVAPDIASNVVICCQCFRLLKAPELSVNEMSSDLAMGTQMLLLTSSVKQCVCQSCSPILCIRKSLCVHHIGIRVLVGHKDSTEQAMDLLSELGSLRFQVMQSISCFLEVSRFRCLGQVCQEIWVRLQARLDDVVEIFVLRTNFAEGFAEPLLESPLSPQMI